MKFEDFNERMNYLFGCMGKDHNKMVVAAFWSNFEEMEIDEFKNLVHLWVRNNKYMPTVSEFLDMAAEAKSPTPSENDIINDILNAVYKIGAYGNPEFSHPISNAIVEEIGWDRLCAMQHDRFNDRIHFQYDRIVKTWKHCAKNDLAFPINKIKGLFSLQTGSKKQLLEQPDIKGALEQMNDTKANESMAKTSGCTPNKK